MAPDLKINPFMSVDSHFHLTIVVSEKILMNSTRNGISSWSLNNILKSRVVHLDLGAF